MDSLRTRRNPLGVHLSLFAGTTTTEAVRRAATHARAAGYDILELSLLAAALNDVEGVGRALRDHELTPTCSAGLTRDADVSSDDAEIAARGQAVLERAVETAAALGSTFLAGVLYGRLGAHARPAAAGDLERAAEAIAHVAVRARDLGVTLALEPVNRYETNLLNTAEQTLAFIDRVGQPNVVLQLDTYHAHIEEGNPAAAVRGAGGRLGYVHAGESHRGRLGTGNVDFAGFFGALADAGYSGPIVFESFSAGGPAGELAASLSTWRDLWSDPVEVAAEARRFLEEQLKRASRS